MIIGCSHPNGLNVGFILPGPAHSNQRNPDGSLIDDGKRRFGGYCLYEPNDLEKKLFLKWLESSVDTPLVQQGVVVWAESEPAFQLELLQRRQQGRMAPTVEAIKHNWDA